MPRPTILERAAKYIAAMEAPRRAKGDPQDSHSVVFGAACALVKGFNLSQAQAEPLLRDYCGRSDQPWNESEIRHKLVHADTTPDPQPRGYLLGDGPQVLGKHAPGAAPAKPRVTMAKPVYDVERLREFAGSWAGAVDLIWLANRSALDPALVDTAGFLRALYKPGESVVCFDNEYSQGCAMWPADEAKLPRDGKNGCWYLAQPVDGGFHPNPRSLDKAGNPKQSRRSEESVTSWRYLVIESDEAPLRLWLGALVKLPLRIAAIYTSGGRSVHALVRVDAKTKEHWDAIKMECFGQNAPAGRFLITNGADKGVLSAVRLTRLPGCMRLGKFKEEADGSQTYVRFPQPQLQKLLYINPEPAVCPLVDLFAKRDVEHHWGWLAQCGISDADDDAGRWLFDGLAFYATRSAKLQQALEGLRARYP